MLPDRGGRQLMPELRMEAIKSHAVMLLRPIAAAGKMKEPPLDVVFLGGNFSAASVAQAAGEGSRGGGRCRHGDLSFVSDHPTKLWW